MVVPASGNAGAQSEDEKKPPGKGGFFLVVRFAGHSTVLQEALT